MISEEGQGTTFNVYFPLLLDAAESDTPEQIESLAPSGSGRILFVDDDEAILSMGGIRRILLDNFSVAQTRDAVTLINKRVETESSGGITRDTIRDYAECGVDYISVGALTHQIHSLDLSLKAEF